MKTILIIVISALFLSCEDIKESVEEPNEIILTKVDSVKEVLKIDDYQERIIEFIVMNSVSYDTIEFTSKTSVEAVILDETDFLRTKNFFLNKSSHFSMKKQKNFTEDLS